MRICKDCKILKPLSDFYKRKSGLIYVQCKKCYLDRYSPNRGKPNAGRFKKGLVPWNRKMENGRRSIKAREWALAVFERDKKCVNCGAIKDLNSHHVKDWNKYPKLRFDLNNGKVLCRSCHAIEHGKKKCNFLKNGKPWINGKKMSKQHCKKLSIAHKGITPKTAFKKGNIPWNRGSKGLVVSGMKGRNHTEESKIKMSRAHKGKKLSEEHKKKLRGRVPYMNGKKHSDESKKKISASLMGKSSWMKGRKLPEKLRLKLIEANTGSIPWNKGKKLSDKHREKLTLSWRKRKDSIESFALLRLKFSRSQKKRFEIDTVWNKGSKLSDDHRRKLSIAQKERFKRSSVWNKGKKMSKEYCKKLSDIHKKRIESLKEKL